MRATPTKRPDRQRARIARAARGLVGGLLLLGASAVPGCGGSPPVPQGPGQLVIRDPGGQHFPNYHDFGKVPHGALLRHTFVMDNPGSTPVRVLEVQTECHCTRVGSVTAFMKGGAPIAGDPTRKGSIIDVPPQARVEFEVVVDTGLTHNYNRDKLAIMRMRTDSKVQPFLTFELHLIAQKLFQLSPAEVRLDEVPASNGLTTAVRILRDQPDTVADILGVRSQGKWCEATIEKDYHFDDPVWTVLVKVPPGLPMGPLRDLIVLETTDDTGGTDEDSVHPLELPIYGRVVEDVQFYPARLAFGPIELGSEAVIDAYLKALVPGAWVGVVSATVEGPVAEHVTIELSPKADDGRGRSPVWDVLLRAAETLPEGPFEGTVRLELDDSQTPEIVRAFSGVVNAP